MNDSPDLSGVTIKARYTTKGAEVIGWNASCEKQHAWPRLLVMGSREKAFRDLREHVSMFYPGAVVEVVHGGSDSQRRKKRKKRN